jgi:single-strand DNA-binding protein
MSGSVNKVILVGNVGRDPEVRSMGNDSRVCNLSLATSESWKDKNGERQERTQWHRVVIFNEPLIRVAEQFLRKGSRVYVEGQIESRKYTDKDGSERTTTEIVLRPYRGELQILDRREGGAPDGDRQERGERQGGGRNQGRNQPPAQQNRDDSVPDHDFFGGGDSDIDF